MGGVNPENFEIVVDLTFWSGLEASHHKGYAWWPHPFFRQKWPKNSKVGIDNLDFSPPID